MLSGKPPLAGFRDKAEMLPLALLPEISRIVPVPDDS